MNAHDVTLHRLATSAALALLILHPFPAHSETAEPTELVEPAESASTSATAVPPSALILGGTAYYESSRLDGEEHISVQERDESFDYRNANALSARLLYLRPTTERLFVGGGADFIGTYRATLLGEDGPSDPPQYYEFGPLLELLGVAEWRIDLTDKLTLGLGSQLGLAALFPRGDLGDEIRSLQNDEVTVWALPRIGGSIGAHSAFLVEIDDRLALRVDAGVQWQNILLFRTRQTVGETAYRKNWTTGALRGRLGISLEVSL